MKIQRKEKLLDTNQRLGTSPHLAQVRRLGLSNLDQVLYLCGRLPGRSLQYVILSARYKKVALRCLLVDNRVVLLKENFNKIRS